LNWQLLSSRRKVSTLTIAGRATCTMSWLHTISVPRTSLLSAPAMNSPSSCNASFATLSTPA
jgi:hypothetical protein